MVVLIEVLEPGEVNLGEHYEVGFVGEERLDVLEKRDLLGDGLAAGLRNVDEEKHAGLQMGQRGDGLHLDGVALFQRVVQNARRVDHLPSHVVVVGVSVLEDIVCFTRRKDSGS